MTETIAAPKRNVFSVLGGMLFSPMKTFTYMREQGSRAWIIMVLLAVSLSVLPAVVSGPLVGQQAQEAFLQATEGQEFEGPEGEEGLATAAGVVSSPIITTVLPAVGSLVGLLFNWFLWGGTLHLISMLAGGRNSFGQMWQVVIWSWLPYAIRSLVQTIYIAVTQTLIENPGLSGFVASPASDDPFNFVPPSPGQLALQSLLSRIDIYLFWQLALLVVGLMVMAQVSRRKGLGMVLIVWSLFTLLAMGVAMAGGMVASSFGPG